MRLFGAQTCPLLKLARRGKWDAVEEMLLADRDCSLIRTSCPTLLHQLLRHNPPVDIIDLAILRMQTPDIIVEEECDEQGRTPLHVAASHGCDSRIVKMLLTGVSGVMPALVKDKAGNTALHAACSVNFDAYRKQPKPKTMACMNNATEIVAKLLQANPEAAHLRNKQGETPLGLAKKHHADARIISRIEVAQQSCRVGEKGCCDIFQAPLSSNELSIVSRPTDALEASFSSVGFDNDCDESSSSLNVPAECKLSAVAEERDAEFVAGVALLSI